MRAVWTLLYAMLMTAGLAASLAVVGGVEHAHLSTLAYGTVAAAAVVGALSGGNKTALQRFFAAMALLAFTATLSMGLGWLGWVGFGLCAFLTLTMKLDGGDDDMG